LGLDLTINLIHVIEQQIQKIGCEVTCTIAIEKYAKSVANWKELSSFMLDIFQISQQTRRIRKNRNHQKI